VALREHAVKTLIKAPSWVALGEREGELRSSEPLATKKTPSWEGAGGGNLISLNEYQYLQYREKPPTAREPQALQYVYEHQYSL